MLSSGPTDGLSDRQTASHTSKKDEVLSLINRRLVVGAGAEFIHQRFDFISTDCSIVFQLTGRDPEWITGTFNWADNSLLPNVNWLTALRDSPSTHRVISISILIIIFHSSPITFYTGITLNKLAQLTLSVVDGPGQLCDSGFHRWDNMRSLT